MDPRVRSFLSDLLATPSPTGFELEGQREWAKFVQPFVDHIDSDTYGNTWGMIAGEGEHRLMLEAHADEIGMMVNHISDAGFLHVTRIGGMDRALIRGRRVRVLGSKGGVVGLVGHTAIHLRDAKDDKVPEWHEIYIDIGASSRQEVEEMGVRVGHPAVVDEPVLWLGDNRIVARALDNRIGGFVIARVLQELASGPKSDASVFGVNAVQEEIGGNGARMITYRLRPTVAVVIDVTHATDSPGISHEKHGKVVLGGGPTVSHGTANHPLVVERLMEVAAGEEIPLQHEASSRFTGTDADDVFVSRTGVPVALLSVPMRYMHSTVEMVDLADVDHCIR
ncbi:MAG: M42 family metallopeptidase, partial [Bacteroidota bacterium]